MARKLATATVRRTPVDVVTEFLRALETQDHDAIAALLAPGLEYTNVSLPTIRGGERVAALMRRGLRPGTAFAAEIHNIAADGDTVMTERTDYLQAGPLRLGFWVCGTFRVRDGRIELWRDYFDWMDIGRATVRGLAGIVLPGLRPKLPSR